MAGILPAIFIVFDISGLEKDQVKNTIDIVEPKNIGLYVFLSSSAVYSDKEKRPFSERTLLGKNSVWGEYGENILDTSKINNIYTPKTNMKEELANCYEWY